MDNGIQFLDIIFFALIAGFLILRLRSVLGRRDGHEGGYQDPFRRNRQDSGENGTDQDDNIIPLPNRSGEQADNDQGADDYVEPGYHRDDDEEEEADPNNPLTAGRTQIKIADPSFNDKDFIAGARIAFEVVLGAYASGDYATLRSLLNDDVYENFENAIRNREQAGEMLEETLVGITNAKIVELGMNGDSAVVTVKFVSEQIMALYDEGGTIIDGDPDKVIKNIDYWTFTRDTRNNDPNWLLVATANQE